MDLGVRRLTGDCVVGAESKAAWLVRSAALARCDVDAIHQTKGVTRTRREVNKLCIDSEQTAEPASGAEKGENSHRAGKNQKRRWKKTQGGRAGLPNRTVIACIVPREQTDPCIRRTKNAV